MHFSCLTLAYPIVCIFTAISWRILLYAFLLPHPGVSCLYAFLLPYPGISYCMHFCCHTLPYRCLFVCIFTAVPYCIGACLCSFLLPSPMATVIVHACWGQNRKTDHMLMQTTSFRDFFLCCLGVLSDCMYCLGVFSVLFGCIFCQGNLISTMINSMVWASRKKSRELLGRHA